jgi:hypothetical protein
MQLQAMALAAMRTLETLNFDNKVPKQLKIDQNTQYVTRPVRGANFSRVDPTPVNNPQTVAVSHPALQLLDIGTKEVRCRFTAICHRSRFHRHAMTHHASPPDGAQRTPRLCASFTMHLWEHLHSCALVAGPAQCVACCRRWNGQSLLSTCQAPSCCLAPSPWRTATAATSSDTSAVSWATAPPST